VKDIFDVPGGQEYLRIFENVQEVFLEWLKRQLKEGQVTITEGRYFL
jgi:putative intracellular protease/amidase